MCRRRASPPRPWSSSSTPPARSPGGGPSRCSTASVKARPCRGRLSRCESRGGHILAATSEFLGRNGAAELHVVDEDPWPSRAAAAFLAALGLWLVLSAFVTLRARSFLPRYRPAAPRPPVYPP